MAEEIPYIITFECGTRDLITMWGRQPLCLFCQEVGHVLNICPQQVNAIFNHRNDSVSETEVVREVAHVTIVKSSAQKDDFQVVENKKNKAKSQKKQISTQEETPTEKEEGKMEAQDLEVSGEKRGRKGLITGSKRVCDTEHIEELSPLPKNRYAVLEIEDLEERNLVIDLDSQDVNMTTADLILRTNINKMSFQLIDYLCQNLPTSL
ncbi:hypothetical protein DPMN_027267 [Dreissena polymorpha]|uniref:Uncharacterized protein n=1 Tax=Dreissena polymorpha TaxID=45954 RepID=A0A9D4LWP2_DREPO|nr:hypothetical protein DPMN_027267 [Dreissena polymorpha]